MAPAHVRLCSGPIRSPGITVAIGLLTLIAIAPVARAAQSGDGPTPEVERAAATWTSTDGSQHADGAKLTFPAPVRWAFYDSTTRQAVVQYDPNFKPSHATSSRRSDSSPARRGKVKAALVACSVESGTVSWEIPQLCTYVAARDSVLVARVNSGLTKIDLVTGSPLGGDVADVHLLEPDGIPLSFNGASCSRSDLRSSRIIWSRNGGPPGGYSCILRRGDTLCFYANGISMLNVLDGNGWDHRASTFRNETGRGLAGAAAAGFLAGLAGAMTGTVVVPGTSPTPQASNLFSRPWIESDRVYYAARASAMCLRRDTGDPLWESDLGYEPGTMRIVPAGANVAVLGLGWRLIDGGLKEMDPTVALVSRDSGIVVAHTEVKGSGTMLDAVWAADGLLLLFEKHLYRLDRSLQTQGTLDAPATVGSFRSFAWLGDTLICRASDQDLEISPVSLEMLATRSLSDPEVEHLAAGNPSEWVETRLTSLLVSPPANSDPANDRRREAFGLDDFNETNGALLHVDNCTVTILPPERAQ